MKSRAQQRRINTGELASSYLRWARNMLPQNLLTRIHSPFPSAPLPKDWSKRAIGYSKSRGFASLRSIASVKANIVGLYPAVGESVQRYRFGLFSRAGDAKADRGMRQENVRRRIQEHLSSKYAYPDKYCAIVCVPKKKKLTAMGRHWCTAWMASRHHQEVGCNTHPFDPIGPRDGSSKCPL